MEKIFENILDNLDDAICLINSDKTIIFANKNYCKLYDKQAKDLLGKSYHILIPPGDAEKIDARFNTVLNSDTPQKYNWYLIQDDGSVLTLSSYNYKMEVSGTTLVVSKLREISLEKKKEKLLEESEKLAQIGGWEYEVNSKRVRWSEEIFRIHELENKVVPDLETCISFYNPESRKELSQLIEDSIKNYSTFDKCFKLITAKGNEKWVRVSCKPEMVLGNTFRLFGTIQDVTIMKEKEDELKKLSLVASKTTNGVIVTNKKNEIEWINSGFTVMYGYTLDEVISKKPSEILRSDTADLDVSEFIDSQTISKKPLSADIINRRKDGSKFWVHIDATPIFDEIHNFNGYVTITTDIDRLKNSEAQLKQKNDELLKTNQELDNFVYSVSHDIRAPIASILGLISIAKTEQNDETQLNYLGIIEDNINRLDSFVRDIVDYSQNSRLEVQPEEIDFQELISECISKNEFYPNFKSIKFESNFEIDAPFFSDSHRIKVILNNLISNSISFHDVSKTSPTVKLSVSTSRENAVITIEDNGQGINEEIQPKIYDMFFSTDYAATGSGLGLYIVKESLKKLNGHIELKSSFGIGTTFNVFIPNLSPYNN